MQNNTNKSPKQAIRRTFKGKVVSNRMKKTIVVLVEWMKIHPLYHRQYKQSRRYKVHDEKNQYTIGDVVRFTECRPISKDKRWRVIYEAKSNI